MQVFWSAGVKEEPAVTTVCRTKNKTIMKQAPANTLTPKKAFLCMRVGSPEQLKVLTEHRQQECCQQISSSLPESHGMTGKKETR